MPEGGQQQATGRPHSVEDWGETHGARTPRVYLEERGLNGRPRVAAGSTTHHHLEATGERPEEMGKNPVDEGNDVPEGPKAGRAKEDLGESSSTERCTGQHWLEHVVDSNDRRTATTSREWQGASARGQL